MSPSNSGAGLVPATQSVGGFEWLYKAVTGADAASPKAQAQPQVQTLPEQRQDSRDEIGIRHLMNSVVKVPRRVYFYWIVRSQEEAAAATVGETTGATTAAAAARTA